MIPEIQNAFDGWESQLTFIKVTQTIVNFQTKNVEEIIYFDGVIQPFGSQQLMIKPISERSWQWYMVHSRIQIPLTTGDKIMWEDQPFKVMSQNPYNINGYYEYHIVRDYA